MLILPMQGNKYEIRIYLSEGYIREEITSIDAATNPDNAEKISKAESFQLDLSQREVLHITIDGNEAVAHLGRYGQ
jgi:hypothetical protein